MTDTTTADNTNQPAGIPMKPTVDLDALSRQLADLAKPNGATAPGAPPQLGNNAADSMKLLTMHAAADIAKLGDTVMATANAIHNECIGLARLIVDRGEEVSILIKNFAALTKHVGVIKKDSAPPIRAACSPSLMSSHSYSA
jgi:hypothetical protein